MIGATSSIQVMVTVVGDSVASATGVAVGAGVGNGVAVSGAKTGTSTGSGRVVIAVCSKVTKAYTPAKSSTATTAYTGMKTRRRRATALGSAGRSASPALISASSKGCSSIISSSLR